MVDLLPFPPPGARARNLQARRERAGRLRRMAGPFAGLLLAGLAMNLGPVERGSGRAVVPPTLTRLAGSFALPDSWTWNKSEKDTPLPRQPRLAAASSRPIADRVETQSSPAARLPRIKPDYLEVVIPPNLAPLNLTIQEAGLEYRLHVSGARGQPLELRQSHPHVRFPLQAWKALLDANRGGALRWGISVRGPNGAWFAFTPFETRVADADIDPYLVYRRLRPLYSSYRHLGIYQRCLETFEEEPVLRNEAIGHGCVNCHTFLQGSPDRFALSLRGRSGTPTLLITSNRIERIDVKLGYLAWHPNGRLLAFSANAITQFFHLAGPVNREVYDPRSDLAILHLGDQTEERPPAIARPDRNENWPSWAPDGRHLYYCSAPVVADQDVPKVRYDLLRIAYDPDQNRWGEPETLVAAADFQRSAHQPRVSPDNRSLVFTASDYGSFPLFRPESDLFLLRLETREIERLPINSNQAETWHCWSSNGRWLIFVSRGLDGVFARVLISHVDAAARFSKPLLLPQEDPTYYDTCLDNFNAPELVRGRIQISEDELARAYNTRSDPTKPSPAVPGRGADRPQVSDNPYPTVP